MRSLDNSRCCDQHGTNTLKRVYESFAVPMRSERHTADDLSTVIGVCDAVKAQRMRQFTQWQVSRRIDRIHPFEAIGSRRRHQVLHQNAPQPQALP